MSTTLSEGLHNLHNFSMENSQMFNNYCGSSTTSVSEIIELEEEINNNTSKLYLDNDVDDDYVPNNHMTTITEELEESVYVAVDKSETSMEALTWTLKNLVTPSSSTIVYLIHVFPEIKYIPNPLGVGMVPKSQVNAEQVESYMAQERGKRRELLHKFLQTCSARKVKVDTILIESDFVAKAILDLIPILQITELVLGANKSQLRKQRSRKGNNGMADEVLQNAPESCKVRIVCEGKEVTEIITTASPSPRSTIAANDTSSSSMPQSKDDHVPKDSASSCICFNFKKA